MGIEKTPPQSGLQEPKDVPDLLQRLMEGSARLMEIDAGEPVPGTRDSGGTVHCVLSGRAEVVVGFRAVQEVIVESLEPGDVFGDIEFLTGRRRPADAHIVASEPSRLLAVPLDDFQRILRENPELTVALLKCLGKKLIGRDRKEFSRPAHLEGADSIAVCSYPSHPGLPEEVFRRFQALALSGESVLIVGENGVGKEMIAYAIFEAAQSHKEVFVPVDARNLATESQFRSSELNSDRIKEGPSLEQMKAIFGYETGGPEGSSKLVHGHLHLADEGTLFVRDAHLLSAVCQQRLLDAWRTSWFCPVGAGRLTKVNVRLICTTEVSPSRYRTDRHPLLSELERNALIIPPLRERRDQVPAIAAHYLGHYAREMGRPPPTLQDLTVEAMVDYSWPGNDLELANAMRRAALVAPGESVRRQDLTFEALPSGGSGLYDLLKIPLIRQVMLSPLFPPILQSAFVPIFLGIVLLLFLGPPDPTKNLGAVIMWSLAWPGVIIGAFLGARLSCSICAIGALSKQAQRLVSLEFPFPEPLRRRSDFLIAGGILFIIWLENVTDIRSSPFKLGLLLLTMFLTALLLNTLFARQTWCRYLCPLGGITGLFARTSVLALRADSRVCLSKCGGHECYFGTPNTEGCPFGQVAATLHSNQFCKVCGNCVKNCPFDAVRLYVRIPGEELVESRYVRSGTGFLVLSLNAALLSDIATRIPGFDQLVTWMPGSRGFTFTLVYVASIAIVNLMAVAAASISYRAFRESFWENYSRFALALLPLTGGAFLAFHAYYLLTLGPTLLGLLGQYFRIEFLADARPTVPSNVIGIIQYLLLACGCLWSLITMYRLGRSSPRGHIPRRWGILSHAGTALILSFGIGIAMSLAFPG
ncbi:MAG: sigma 54-interacting transcriptional regulator [Desulfomonilaceae bacterium]|nr:sigma 54-interacting transcriptional regulator [Desulfomonilaceae bacterium]